MATGKFTFALTIGIFFGLLLSVFFFIYPISGFFVSKNQIDFISRLNKELSRNNQEIKLDILNPDPEWNSVCFILPSAYSTIFSPKVKIAKFYGNGYQIWRPFLPNPISKNFFLGFAFQNDGRFHSYYGLRNHKFTLTLSGVKVESLYLTDGEKNIFLANMTIEPGNNKSCFARENTYISISERTLKIGER